MSDPWGVLLVQLSIWLLFGVALSWHGLWAINSYLRSNLDVGVMAGIGAGLWIIYLVLFGVEFSWLAVGSVATVWCGVGVLHVWLRRRYVDDVVILWLKDRPSYWNKRVLSTWWIVISFGLTAVLVVTATLRSLSLL